MKMFKKNGGFTLVELIVVIAILAILAGVAIPAYSGYIDKANETADTTTLTAIKTATMAALATEGRVTKIVVEDKNGDTIAVYLDDSPTAATLTDKQKADINTYLNCGASFSFAMKTGSTGTWTAASGKWVISGDPYVPTTTPTTGG